MSELLEDRILGAVRWIDETTQQPIAHALVARGRQLRFIRNLSGLSIIVHADGLEAYSRTFDLDRLPPGQVVANGARSFEGQVEDPTGQYLPRKFTLALPRNASPALLPPDNRRPPDSLFTPIDLALLPAPAARLPAGFAQVRVLITDANGQGLRNALARVVATTGNAVLGCGLADARGEALVAIPGLKHFAPGATAAAVVTVETEARLEIIEPPAGQEVVDWTALRSAPVTAGHTDPVSLKLKPGALVSRRFPFPA